MLYALCCDNHFNHQLTQLILLSRSLSLTHSLSLYQFMLYVFSQHNNFNALKGKKKTELFNNMPLLVVGLLDAVCYVVVKNIFPTSFSFLILSFFLSLAFSFLGIPKILFSFSAFSFKWKISLYLLQICQLRLLCLLCCIYVSMPECLQSLVVVVVVV